MEGRLQRSVPGVVLRQGQKEARHVSETVRAGKKLLFPVSAASSACHL